MQDSFELVGTTIAGKYLVQQVVGEGGFGLVYRGHHLGFDHPIAIKCLKVPAHFTGDARRLFVARFAEEGKLLFRLSEHRSIVRVFDHSIIEIHGHQVPYLVLEWLEGSSLHDYLEQRQRQRLPPLSEIDALRMLRDPIEGLAFAHQLRVAHRDIKPENLFLVRTSAGTVTKLLDFGVAKLMEEADIATQYATATSSGFRAFSPQYGAPEQFFSKNFGQTGPWTDVHAMGLLLTELVTSRPAFDGTEFGEFYSRAIADRRPTPRNRGAEVSSEFEALCADALALESRNRYSSASELLAAVDGHLAAVDAPRNVATPVPQRRRTVWVAAGLTSALVITTVAVVGWGSSAKAEYKEQTTSKASLTRPSHPVAPQPGVAIIDAGTLDSGNPAAADASIAIDTPAPPRPPVPTPNVASIIAPDGAVFHIGDGVFLRKGNDKLARAKLDALANGKAIVDGLEVSMDDISPAVIHPPNWSVGAIALLASTEGHATFVGKVTAVQAKGLTLRYWNGSGVRSVRFTDFEVGTTGLAPPIRARAMWQAPLGRALDRRLKPLAAPNPANPVSPAMSPTEAVRQESCTNYCVQQAGHEFGSDGFKRCMAGLTGCH